MPWDPGKYHQFSAERSAPFDDLLALVAIRPGLRVIDLGCGTGELTARLADHLPASDVLGIDSSPQMLEKALALQRPGLRFTQQNIADVQGSYDLVYSNAAIQWVPDHAALLPRLFSLVAPGGQLAVQLPSNHNSVAHRLIRATAGEDPFRQALVGWTYPSPVLPVEDYAGLLYAAGGQDLLVFEKVYPHVLANAEAVAEWVSGTALVPYFERLGPALKDAFLERYRQKVRAQWPAGPVFYPFRRTFFSARKPAEAAA